VPGLFRVALCGGPPQRIGPEASARAIDDAWLYWVDSSGGIHRTAK
jgi:hypothetical protein